MVFFYVCPVRSSFNFALVFLGSRANISGHFPSASILGQVKRQSLTLQSRQSGQGYGKLLRCVCKVAVSLLDNTTSQTWHLKTTFAREHMVSPQFPVG